MSALPRPTGDALLWRPEPYRIERVRRDLADTFSLDLVPAGGGAPLAFRPGQFNMLYAFGLGEVPISISGDAEAGGPLVHTIRAVGPVTEAMRGLRAGAVLGVRGPFGSHWPVVEAEGMDLVIIAGGVGLAPLRPAIYYALRHRRRFGRVCIFYGARTPDDLLYKAELKRWRGEFDLVVDVTVDRASHDWAGKVGVVTRLVEGGGYDPLHTVALVCGPEVMMRYAARALLARGVAREGIFLSLERNMKCAVGLCGHCQLGPHFVCKDGPVFRLDQVERLLAVDEL